MSIGSGLADLLLPPLCLHCGERLLAARPGCCPACLGGIEALPAAQCTRCGLPRPGFPDRCARCRDWPAGLACRAAVRYSGVAEALVGHLKYRGWLHLAEVCAERMAGVLDPGAVEALVPVPLHPVRQRARGYNQARAIAEALGAMAGHPVLEALQRHRVTRSQVGLGRSARAANVAGAFVCPARPPAAIGLVDDVTTSGATLVEAGRSLLEAGADHVLAIAFALAPENGAG